MFHDAASSPSGANRTAYGFATPVRAPSTSAYPATNANTNTAYSSAHALTPSASSDKAVRFQSQPLPPQTQSQPQPQSMAHSSSIPSRFSAAATPSKPATSSAPPTTSTPSSMALRPTVAPATGASASAGASSTLALRRRLRWNVGALALLWLAPALWSRPRDVYWALLDLIYVHVGGEADELVDGVVSCMAYAISLVLLFNAVEAAILIRRTSHPSPTITSTTATTASTGTGTRTGTGTSGAGRSAEGVLGMHSPSVAKSINFVAASRLKGSPKTRTSSVGANSPLSHARGSPGTSTTVGAGAGVDYAQFSPSRRSNPSTPTGVAGSSPLAAFRARHTHTHAHTGPSSPSHLATRSVTPSRSDELSWDDLSTAPPTLQPETEEAFLGDESFEVDRALKSLRDSLGALSSTPAPATFR